MGAGVFGRWDVDDAGRVCYDYAPPPEKDAPHEDHWHLIGDARTNVTCHNAGYVQIYDWRRGPKLWNRWAPDQGNYAGGFVFLRAHGETFPTLLPWLPEGATMARRFGQGYYQKTTRWRGIVIEEWLSVSGAVAHDVRIRNEGDAPVELTFTPYWQPSIHQIVVAPIMTNGLDRPVEALRARFNRKFRYRIESEDGGFVLHTEKVRGEKTDPETPAYADHAPHPLHLTGFCAFGYPEAPGPRVAGPCMPTPAMADGPRNARDPGPIASFLQTAGLAPGEAIGHRCAVAVGKEGDAVAALDLAMPVSVTLPPAPAMARECAWHASYLQAGTMYSDYFGAHFVDQGSAYGYLQGGSGAPRDYALFVLALVYLNPPLAKESLRFLIRSQKRRDGGFPYATFGHGKASGGGVHSLSSDLDLFVLWALAEYLNVTRDFAFLDEVHPYYPKADGKSATVIEHVRASWKHLTGKIGLGKHGLIRCGTGDWNDVLIAYSKIPPLTILRGESSLNAGLATVALPAMAEALTHVDPDLADAMRAYAFAQGEALRQMWTGEWVARGYAGYANKRIGADRIFLDTQAFGVLGGVWDQAQCDTLFANIQRICVDPQPAGALALYPPQRGLLLQPGSDTNGGTWSAVDGWTTWAWMRHDPAAAWRFFQHSSMATRAEAYPDNWYGIWSGPDAFNAHYHPRPAETFNFNATPMALYPVMNMNRHALPLIDLFKFAGFGADNGAITVDPRFPFDTFAVDTALMGCSYAPDRCEGHYVPVAAGEFRFRIAPPRAHSGSAVHLEVNGQRVSPDVLGESVEFVVSARSGEAITWTLRPAS